MAPDAHAQLLDIARVLLAEEDEKLPETLLHRVLQATGAHRGFIAVREGASFEQKFAVRFDRASSDADRKFSRGLVRQAIETRAIARSSPSVEQSVQASGARAAVAAPLVHGSEVYGVVYLDYLQKGSAAPAPDGATVSFLEQFAEIAALHLRRALDREELRRRNQELERDLFSRYDFRGIVTHDPAMVRLLKTVAQVAATDATVLVRGETGTGKELIARAIHENSPRRARPCVPIHASALPAQLLESELFGHVKGAFTGADRDRAGRFASAHGGTLFLDEIAEIALELQAKLLRVLQFGELQRAGSDKVETVDIRIVAATHQDLAALVEAGKFRRDLYYRLKVVDVVIPPLRERAGDIPLLAAHFLRSFWKGPGEPRFSPRAERALLGYPYPGNVRELAHAVQRACALARGPEPSRRPLRGSTSSRRRRWPRRARRPRRRWRRRSWTR
ncbi:MAG TPA: sigma 54-interacting transcriptional regulator [Myxococcales bacterium]|nr:sigma 54-interacting transcriptional regulator [Myxococcales bacterium]